MGWEARVIPLTLSSYVAYYQANGSILHRSQSRDSADFTLRQLAALKGRHPMQVSYSAAVVLQLVANGFRHGFDIMEASGLPSGTVYPALRRLERSGLLRSKWESETVARRAGRPRRRYYELSRHGVDALGAARRRFPLLQHAPEPVLGEAEPEGA